MALSFPLREALMPSRYTLAAVLRTTRAALGLSRDQLVGTQEARHLHNVEHGKFGVTLEMLEGISERLDIDVVALLAAASSFDRQESLEEYMAHLWTELAKLRDMRILESLPAQFSDGKLTTPKAGKPPITQEKIRAVLKCKANGMTQKETSKTLGLSTTSVHKIWHMPTPDR